MHPVYSGVTVPGARAERKKRETTLESGTKWKVEVAAKWQDIGVIDHACEPKNVTFSPLLLFVSVVLLLYVLLVRDFWNSSAEMQSQERSKEKSCVDALLCSGIVKMEVY